MGETKSADRVLDGKPELKRSLEDLGADVMIILKRILKVMKCGLTSSGTG
jgi:hypothetical protein